MVCQGEDVRQRLDLKDVLLCKFCSTEISQIYLIGLIRTYMIYLNQFLHYVKFPIKNSLI